MSEPTPAERPICACRVHESGRGLVPCLHHAQRIEEHQSMWRLLREIADGKVEDPGLCAERLLGDVRYWHG